MYQKSSDLRKYLIISIYIDFLRFYFPFFCIHWLMGYDVIRRNGEMLSAGVVTALVAQRPEAQGYRAVMALCEWLVEGRAPSKVNNMPIDILLKENIPYYKNNII